MHADVFQARARRQFDHRRKLGFMAVHAARRHQPQHVQLRAIGERGVDRLLQDRIFEKFAAFDVRFDARVVLVNHASRADVQVADLGVAHLRGGQADPLFGGVYGGVGIRIPEEIPVRLARLADRVVVTLFAIPEAIEYDQQHRGYIHDF